MMFLINFILVSVSSIFSFIYAFTRKSTGYTFSDTLIVPHFNEKINNVSLIDYFGTLFTIIMIYYNLTFYVILYNRFKEKISLKSQIISFNIIIIFSSSYAIFFTKLREDVTHILFALLLTFISFTTTVLVLYCEGNERKRVYKSNEKVFVFKTDGYKKASINYMIDLEMYSVTYFDTQIVEEPVTRNRILPTKSTFKFTLQVFTIIYYVIILASLFFNKNLLEYLKTNAAQYEVLISAYIFYINYYLIGSKGIKLNQGIYLFTTLIVSTIIYNLVNYFEVSKVLTTVSSILVFILVFVIMTYRKCNLKKQNVENINVV